MLTRSNHFSAKQLNKYDDHTNPSRRASGSVSSGEAQLPPGKGAPVGRVASELQKGMQAPLPPQPGGPEGGGPGLLDGSLG